MVRFTHLAKQIALQNYIHAVQEAEARLDRRGGCGTGRPCDHGVDRPAVSGPAVSLLQPAPDGGVAGARGHVVNRKRVQRLMRFVGLAAVYQRPNTASSRLRTRSIRICSAGCRASGSTKSGAPTWPGAFSTRWSSELGEPRHVSVALQHARRRFLRHGSGGSPGPLPQARDLQHRQGCQFRLERRGITISMDGNGWEWPLRRQHLRRAAVAQPEV
jgi:hypothetical protein